MVEKFEWEQGHKWAIKKHIKISPKHQHKIDENINFQKVGVRAKPKKMDVYLKQ